MGKISEALKAKLRCDYSETAAVVTDEISVVSNIRLLQIHKRVYEIFGCSEAITEILNSRKGDIENVSADAKVIFTENSPKDSFNKAKYENLSERD